MQSSFMFTLFIETKNAAFSDGASGAEIARILKEITSQVEEGQESGTVKDINGNRVGSFKLASTWHAALVD
jgi:hypothetical protein